MTLPPALIFPNNPASLAVVRELGAAGVHSFVVDSAHSGPASNSRFSTFVKSPDLYDDPGAWADFAATFAREQPDSPVLFPTDDGALLVAERYQRILADGFRFPYPAGRGVIDAVLDKSVLYRVAAEAGVDLPLWFVGETDATERAAKRSREAGRRVDWLTKPNCRYRLGTDGVRTFLARNGGKKALAGDLQRTVSRVRKAGFDALVQERIPGPLGELVSVGLCLSVRGGVVQSFTALKRYEYPSPFGDGVWMERVDDPGLVDVSARLLRSLGYWGICDLEFKRDPRDGRYRLLDANPRAWQWMGLGGISGCRLALAAYCVALGDDLAAFRGRYGARSGTGDGRRRIWVSGRGAAGFLLKEYRPRTHGLALPAKLFAGSLTTFAATLRSYRDPLCVRPSHWGGLARSLYSLRLRRTQEEDA